MRDVLKNLIDGLNEAWVKIGKYWRFPCKSAITQARQRLGAGVMRQLFHSLVRPIATVETVGAFISEFRVVVIDGTCLELPDSDENARVFGRPGSRPGTISAFPKARLVILFEAGTNVIFDALICPYKMGERVRALKLLRSVMPGMLLMWDRGLHSYAMVEATVSKGCKYLGRIPCNVKFLNETQLEDGSYLSWIYPSGKFRKKGFGPIQVRVVEYTIEHPERPETQIRYRLITSLLDAEKFTAQLLACEYHQPWEVENTIDEIKVHLLGRKTHIRSQRPKEVVQEIYGLLLGPKSCKVIDFSSGKQRRCFPIASFFYWNLTSYSSRSPKISAVTTTRTSLFLSWLTWEILDQIIPERVSEKQPKSCQKACFKISVETS